VSRTGASMSKAWLLAVLLAGCAEGSNAPGPPPISADGRFHEVRWAQRAAPVEFRVSRVAGRGSSTGTAAAPIFDGEGSFWAFTERDAGYTVSVLGTDGTWRPYVTLTVPRGSLLRKPGGGEFARQDSVLITLRVDPASLQMELEPTGLVFNPLNPARLSMSYLDSDPDLNRDGRIDGLDDYIGQVLLGLRTREHDGDPWLALPSTNDPVSRQLFGDLHHFTGYAVSW
jgi:hypothetical protein